LTYRHHQIFWRIALLAGFLKGIHHESDSIVYKYVCVCVSDCYYILGFVGTAVGALILPCVLRHDKVASSSAAVGTTIMLVFVASLCALLSRLIIDPSVLETFGDARRQFQLFEMFIWIVPGVLLGGQLGPHVTHRIDKPHMRRYVGVLLVLVGGASIARAAALGAVGKMLGMLVVSTAVGAGKLIEMTASSPTRTLPL
jgi:hypothetical protein